MAQEISSAEQLPSWSKCAASVRACCKCALDYGMCAFSWFLLIGAFIGAIFGYIVPLVLWYQEAMPVSLDPRAIAFVIVSAVMLLLLLMVQDLKMTAMLGHLCLLLSIFRLCGHEFFDQFLHSLSQPLRNFTVLGLAMFVTGHMLFFIDMAKIMSGLQDNFVGMGFGMVLGIFGMVLNLLPFVGTPVCWYWQMETGRSIGTTPFLVALVFFFAGAVFSRLNVGSNLLDWKPTCATWTYLGLYMGLVFPFPFQHLPFKDNQIAWTRYPYEIALCVFLGACASAACILMFFCILLHRKIQCCSFSYEKFSHMDLLSLILRGGCAVLTMASIIMLFAHSTLWASLLLASVGLETLFRLLTLLKRNPRHRCRRCRRATGKPPSNNSATVIGSSHEPEQEQEPMPVFAAGDGERVRDYMHSYPQSDWVAYWFNNFPKYPRKAIDWAKKIFPAEWFLHDAYLCESPPGLPAAQKLLYGKRANHEAFLMTWNQSAVFIRYKQARIRPVGMPEEIDIPFVAQQPAEQLCFQLKVINTFITFKIIDVKVEASLARCSSTPPGF